MVGKLLLSIPIWIGLAQAQNFYLAGTECAASTTPKCGGFVAMAIPIGAGTFSWTKIFEAAPRAGKFAASETTTGLCKDMWDAHFGRVTVNVLGCGAAGSSTAATSTTLALDAGGGVLFSGISRRFSFLKMWIGALQSKSASSFETRAMFSFGGQF
jgi:hypothetical protein